MNHLFLLPLLTSLTASTLISAPPKPSSPATLINEHLTTHIVPLHNELTTQLRTQRSAADEHDRVTCAQAKKVAHEHCATTKRQIQADYLTEKKSRKEVSAALQTLLKKAKRAALNVKGALEEKFSHVDTYLTALAEQAQTAQFTELHKKILSQQNWLKKMRSNSSSTH